MNTKKTKMLNRRNNELDKKVNPENNEVMTNLVCYLRAANISDYHQETIRQDLLEMFLSAQERGESIQTVIGEDYQVFCDEVIANTPKKTKKEKALDLIDTVFLCVAILAAINIFFSPKFYAFVSDLIKGNPLDPSLPLSLRDLIVFAAVPGIAVLIVDRICKTALKPEKPQKKSKLKQFAKAGAIGGGIMALFLAIAWFGREVLFEVNIIAACVFAASCYLIHKLLPRLSNW